MHFASSGAVRLFLGQPSFVPKVGRTARIRLFYESQQATIGLLALILAAYESFKLGHGHVGGRNKDRLTLYRRVYRNPRPRSRRACRRR